MIYGQIHRTHQNCQSNPALLCGLLEVEPALRTHLDAEQDAVVCPVQVVVLGEVGGQAAFGFPGQWLENLGAGGFGGQRSLNVFGVEFSRQCL